MKFAICNETFVGWDHQRICSFLAPLGYRGLEIAPFTLGEAPTQFPKNNRILMRNQARAAGLEIIGLHWLLARTSGFHVTHPDERVRVNTARYLGDLAELCHDLGGSFMVLGSPQQRSRLTGVSPTQAFDYATDTLRMAMPLLGKHGIRLCVEPLGTQETNFINTCSQACELIAAVDHPLCVLHLDIKAMASERETPDDGHAVAQLIREYAPRAGHFHANDPNRRGPGFGAMDFRPIFSALDETHYNGWISVEVFDYSPDPETIATGSLEYMRKTQRQAESAANNKPRNGVRG